MHYTKQLPFEEKLKKSRQKYLEICESNDLNALYREAGSWLKYYINIKNYDIK